MNIMKTMAATLAALTLTGSAFAADLPSRKAPIIVPPPVFTWAGFYGGVNFGYASTNGATTNGAPIFNDGSAGAAAPYAALAALGAVSSQPSSGGLIGGVQAGYNWQFAPSFVGGFEADIQGVDFLRSFSKSSLLPAAGFAAFPFASQISSSAPSGVFGTVRARLGFTVTPTWLLYATGGLAYGSAKNTTNVLETIVPVGGCPACFPGAANLSGSPIRIGWTAGGGLEWMFLPNWSLKAEGLYYSLANVNRTTLLAIPNVGAGTVYEATAITSSYRPRGVIARLGVNYHFNWFAPAPIVAKY
jgi:outer membrane immunogenic protein